MSIKLSRVTRIQGRASRKEEAYGDNWQNLSYTTRERSSWTCAKCSQSFSDQKHLLHSHHIIPLSKGGSNSLGNLTSLCVSCHKEEHR